MESSVGASTKYDAIVVGGGTCGCVLASRLSEDPSRSVLLIESGPGFSGIADCPPELLDEAVFPAQYLWSYEGRPTEADPRQIEVVRGRVLGGSGAVNGMLYARAAPGDYDSWGSPLWADAALRPYFDLIERDLDDPADDGAGVLPLRRTPREEWSVSQRAFFEAALEAGHPQVEDHLPNTEDGIGAIARNCLDGVRMSAALTYLARALGRPNLRVQAGTTVDRVLFEGRVAVGVVARAGEETVEIRGDEVLLAAGAIESPHLLILSGIGPREVLERLDIPVVAARSGVGRNYFDHPNLRIVASLRPGVERGDMRHLAALRHTTAGSDVAGDLYLIARSEDCSAELGGAMHLCLFPILHSPESSGEVEVVSADPAVQPRVSFNYLAADSEMRTLMEGARLSLTLLESTRLRDMVEEVVSPAPADRESRESLEAWIEGNLTTTLHGSGSCRIGSPDDAEAVVDFHGRVIGVEGLRVADLSVSPSVVRAPTNATAMVIAERMAHLMRTVGG